MKLLDNFKETEIVKRFNSPKSEFMNKVRWVGLGLLILGTGVAAVTTGPVFVIATAVGAAGGGMLGTAQSSKQ